MNTIQINNNTIKDLSQCKKFALLRQEIKIIR